MQKRRRFALLGARLDFSPGARKEFHVGANFFRSGARGSGANDEAAAGGALCVVHQMAQTRALFGGSDFARDAGVIERRHVNQEASGKATWLVMRAPFLPSGSFAIWTMISWPCFSMSAISCGRRGCVPEWLMAAAVPVLRTASAIDRGDRRDRGLRGAPDSACATRKSLRTRACPGGCGCAPSAREHFLDVFAAGGRLPSASRESAAIGLQHGPRTTSVSSRAFSGRLRDRYRLPPELSDLLRPDGVVVLVVVSCLRDSLRVGGVLMSVVFGPVTDSGALIAPPALRRCARRARRLPLR